MPQAAAPGMGDHSTAMSMFGAIMTGLYRREKTGKGSFVSTSLRPTACGRTGWRYKVWSRGSTSVRSNKGKGWVNPFTGVYRCRDGRFVVFAGR